jgi:hypothetical protein
MNLKTQQMKIVKKNNNNTKLHIKILLHNNDIIFFMALQVFNISKKTHPSVWVCSKLKYKIILQ